jgi:methylamine---glutamate N-methyltransferase subunit A
MCGIAGLHLRGDQLRDRLGSLLAAMMGQLCERGPDSAGIGLYGDATLARPGWSTVSVLARDPAAAARHLEAAVVQLADAALLVTVVDAVVVVSAACPLDRLTAQVRATLPDGAILSTGHELAVLKGVGDPRDLAVRFGLAGRSGHRGVAHTRMATESAVTVAHGHPFSVRPDLCLVHNGSFANHSSIRRGLARRGITCDTDNDSEVAARFVGWRLDEGDSLEKALRALGESFDGFFTLLVTTDTEFAVVRDAIACKPALVAETAGWVAMASEYRALAELPGIEQARVFEPDPAEVYLWAA